MESFRYHDLGRIAYADALEYQTAAFEVLLDAMARTLICLFPRKLYGNEGSRFTI